MYFLRRIPRPLSLTVAMLVALGYFLFHAEHGSYGHRASIYVRAEVNSLEAELAGLKNERDRLEHAVSLMRPESLDPDLLEELVRADLGYVSETELVLFNDIPPSVQ